MDTAQQDCGSTAGAAMGGPAPGLVGERVGRWRVEREIGRGAMAVVYLARHETMGTRVALKVLHASCAADADLARRFANEARVQASLSHPNLARTFDLFALPDGRPCIVMEHLDGETLEERAGQGPMDARQAVEILLQVCSGLAVAHAAGVVHRDIKAENVLLVRAADGVESVKIVDFGIAQLRAVDAIATVPGLIMGTPYYMAPEQALGQEVDARADVYAVGVLAFRLLAGEMPFEGKTATEVMFKHVREPARRLSGVPASLANAVASSLAKDRAKRPADAGELGFLLRECRRALRDERKPAPLPVVTPEEARAEVEHLRSQAGWGPYALLGIEPDASLAQIRRARQRLEQRLDALTQVAGPELQVHIEALRVRLAQVGDVLEDLEARAWHDAAPGNFLGVARSMAEGLSARRLEEMEREWSALHADRAQTARSLLEAADMYLKIGDRARALEQVKRALQSSPLSAEAHRRYWSLQQAQQHLGEARAVGG